MKKTPKIQESDLEVRITGDGSKTIARKDTGLLYRSAHGAQKESLEVFVQGAKLHTQKSTWRIFELGFGTGMNFSTTYALAKKTGVDVHYEAVDHLPIPPIYAKCTWTQKALLLVRKKQEKVTIPLPTGVLILHPHPFDEVQLDQEFDAIYHDPFGPSANPECWTKECFEKEVRLLSDTGIWTSYGASGEMRRALAAAGCYVAVGPGIGKKRETTRASKCIESLAPHKIKYTPQQNGPKLH